MGSDNEPKYLPGFDIDVFTVPAATELGEPIASTSSNARGFYEIALPASDYVLCSSFRR